MVLARQISWRRRPERANQVWSYDVVHHRIHDDWAFRILNVLDEFTRESLSIRVWRRLSSTDVIEVMTDLFLRCRVPSYIRSDHGAKFAAEADRQWTVAARAQAAFIAPGTHRGNSCIEGFNARLRDEFLKGETF